MRFMLVNDRTPCPQSVCALCGRPIGPSYLREIETRFSYCDQRCYAEHSDVKSTFFRSMLDHFEYRL